MKVLIADDHIVIRKGIAHILLEEFPLAETEEVMDTGSLIELAILKDWDIIISDISMPGGGGIEALKKILQQKPAQKILIMTSYSEDQYALPVFNAGATGFINKDTASEQLVIAVRIILSGKKFFPPWVIDNY